MVTWLTVAENRKTRRYGVCRFLTSTITNLRACPHRNINVHGLFPIFCMDTVLCLRDYGQTYKTGPRAGSSNSKCKLFIYIQCRVRNTPCSTSAPSVRKVHYPSTHDTTRVGYLSRPKWRDTSACKPLANRQTEVPVINP